MPFLVLKEDIGLKQVALKLFSTFTTLFLALGLGYMLWLNRGDASLFLITFCQALSMAANTTYRASELHTALVEEWIVSSPMTSDLFLIMEWNNSWLQAVCWHHPSAVKIKWVNSGSSWYCCLLGYPGRNSHAFMRAFNIFLGIATQPLWIQRKVYIERHMNYTIFASFVCKHVFDDIDLAAIIEYTCRHWMYIDKILSENVCNVYSCSTINKFRYVCFAFKNLLRHVSINYYTFSWLLYLHYLLFRWTSSKHNLQIVNPMHSIFVE